MISHDACADSRGGTRMTFVGLCDLDVDRAEYASQPRDLNEDDTFTYPFA